MQRLVDTEILAGVSSAVLVNGHVADLHCAGWADREAGVLLRPDHIFRVFSNTKLVTACAAMQLLEQGRFQLDDPIGRYLPQLAVLRVLRSGATSLDDTEPQRSPVTIRQLLCHTSGLAFGLLDPGTLLFEAYARAGVRDPNRTLAEMVEALGGLPLLFHPGTAWAYSMATDVIGRLVEVLSGEPIGSYFQRRIFDPLGMTDTHFTVPPQDRSRLVACYAGASRDDPWEPGLSRSDGVPYPGAYLEPFPRQAAGGGLVSTVADWIALLRSLLPGGHRLLQPQTIALMMTNQLAPGLHVSFPGVAPTPGKGYGLAGAVTVEPSLDDLPQSIGDLEWGGIAGTHWWVSRTRNIAGVVMAQRQWAFWHPFSFELKRLAYRVALAQCPR